MPPQAMSRTSRRGPWNVEDSSRSTVSIRSPGGHRETLSDLCSGPRCHVARPTDPPENPPSNHNPSLIIGAAERPRCGARYSQGKRPGQLNQERPGCAVSADLHLTERGGLRRLALMANSIVHFEIMGRPGPDLPDFYRSLFDWPVSIGEPVNTYAQHSAIPPQGGEGIGGGIGATEEGQCFVTGLRGGRRSRPGM